MAKYVVQIKDYSDNEFSLLITVPVFSAPTWQTIEKGWLRYNSGQAVFVDKTPLPMQGAGLEGFRRHKHLYICTYQWGGVLFDFMGWTDANDAGRGFLKDEWAVYADSGPLGWSVIG